MINDPSEFPEFSLGAAAAAMLDYVDAPLAEKSGAQHRVTSKHSYTQETQPTEAGAFYGEHASPTHDKGSCSYCQPGR